MAEEEKKEAPCCEETAQSSTGENTKPEEKCETPDENKSECKEKKKCKKNDKECKHEAEIKAMQAKIDEANDKLYRVAAEYDNFRKRSQKEKDAIYSSTKVEVLAKLLPVIDNFERAAASSADDFEGYKKGMEMTFSQFADIIKDMGVEAFGEKGDAFDANIHNAVMHGEDEDAPENSVSDVFQKGYRLGDKILRFATVKVVN